MSYKNRAAGDDSESSNSKPSVEPRTDYRCAAWGCPNAGSINDKDAKHRGVCGPHYQSEMKDWANVTARILRTGVRNFGDQPWPDSSPLVKRMRSYLREGLPDGIMDQNGHKMV